MKLTEILEVFQQMSACDRIYLLCKMLQCCITYELNFVSMVLQNTLKEKLLNVSKVEGDVNKVTYYSIFEESGVFSEEPLEKLSCALALVTDDNQPVAEAIFKLLDQRSILVAAEETEDFCLLEKLRLVYVMSAYHPSFTFSQRHHLLTVYLHQLDEMYDYKLAEIETKEREEREAALAEIERPTRPSDDAYIIHCELKGVYKRQSDRRYPYVIEVEWSDGAYCHVQRTYGDFFSFQNKLLDLFPEESGQKNKKLRVIPFLPGRRLLSGKSNRELAEKRLPDMCRYTHDLFQLPKHIKLCKHVLDFFRPRLSDIRDNSLPFHKMTTLLDFKNSESSKIRHPSAPAMVLFNRSPSNSPSRPRSTINSHLVNLSGGGRVSHTLPINQSPGQTDSNIIRRSTYPVRPKQSAFTPVTSTPSSSTEKLHSSSQTSLSSVDRIITPTTTACHVVTPPITRSNGSPAFAVSTLSSSSWSSVTILTQSDSPASVLTLVKPVRNQKAKLVDAETLETRNNKITNIELEKKTKSSVSMETNTTVKETEVTTTSSPVVNTVTTSVSSNWADRSSPPSNTDTSFTFTAITSTPTPVMTTVSTVSTSNIFSPSPTSSITSTPIDRSVSYSPSLPQFYQHGGTYPPYSPYPVSYTPTNFESRNSSPKPIGSGHWQGSYTPICHTPICHTPTEMDHFRKWLKVHRLHKYDYLFQKMTFEEVGNLEVDTLKEMGMTQGAAKKLQQKMDELRKSNITSFREIPLSSLSRKPSTSSLPAALFLERQQLTPSSSIDQLSLHGSTCSLDILGQSYIHHPKSSRHSDGATNDAIISTIDTAILETGPINSSEKYRQRSSAMELSGNDTGEGGRSHEPLSRSKSSQGNLQMSNGLPSLPSNDPTVSHPPLKGQRSLSPHHNLLDQIVPSESSSNQKLTETTNRERVRSFPEENLSRTNILSPTQQQTFNTPQFHRKDVPPSSVGGIGIITIPQDGQSTVEPHGNHHHQPRIPPGLIPSNRMPNWSHPGVVHGPIVVPNSIPIFRGRVQHPVLATYGPINGLVRSPAGLAQIGIRYPVNPTLQGIPLQSTTPIPTITRLTSPPFTCYNCGSQGHQGSKCVSSLSENSSMKDSQHHFSDKTSYQPHPIPSPSSSLRETTKR